MKLFKITALIVISALFATSCSKNDEVASLSSTYNQQKDVIVKNGMLSFRNDKALESTMLKNLNLSNEQLNARGI